MTLPELVAHRGYQLHYPENTLPAVEAALRAGARFVEIDIQLSRDRVPMVFHDEDLARICGVPGMVKDCTAEQLQRLRASEYQRFGYRYARVRIPTLAEFTDLLGRYPDVTAFVELKQESLAHFGNEAMVARVSAALNHVRDRAVIISYAFDALLAARRAGWPTLGAVLERWRDRRQSAIREIKPQYLFCDVNALPAFGQLRVDGARLAVFEVGDATTALRLARRGVDLIETFALGELRRALDLLSAA